MKTIAIIGAGAAGLMTAATILESVDPLCKEGAGKVRDLSSEKNPQSLRASSFTKEPLQIHLFEKNKTPGNKIIISGGGRCNVTTSITDKKILATKYTRGWDFIRKAMGKFSPAKTYEWFEAHGVPLKTQADMRVFPVSDDGNDVVDAFERVFAKYRDKIIFHYSEGVSVIARKEPVPATSDVAIQTSGVSVIPGLTRDPGNNNESSPAGFLPTQEGQIHGETQDKKYTITTSKGIYHADILVITTGGNAYSHTGSTGDGYAFARTLGHTVTTLGPSLSSFLTSESWTHALSGLAFENARIGELIGPLLLTHFGLSGPLAFMYSSQIAWEKLDKNTPKTIYLSPIADMDREMWDSFLKSEFSLHPKKTITTILSEKLARRFVDGFVSEFFSHIADTYVSGVSKADRLRIAELLGNGLPITLIERRPGDEFVTAGGVSTDELNAETMESRIHEGLYFAGEVLNVDGYTGGFSLQICWSSGYTAGRDIASKIL